MHEYAYNVCNGIGRKQQQCSHTMHITEYFIRSAIIFLFTLRLFLMIIFAIKLYDSWMMLLFHRNEILARSLLDGSSSLLLHPRTAKCNRWIWQHLCFSVRHFISIVGSGNVFTSIVSVSWVMAATSSFVETFNDDPTPILSDVLHANTHNIDNKSVATHILNCALKWAITLHIIWNVKWGLALRGVG